MSSERATDRPEELSKQPPRTGGDGQTVDKGSPPVATVVMHGELVRNPVENPREKENGKDKAPRKVLSEAKVAMQRRLPALDDDAQVGVQKDHRVTRDGKADLSFTGTLLASAAPPSAPQGQWKEYRVYETTGGKYVFSKVGRNVEAGKQDTHEADVFDPAPQSMPSKLLKGARELAHAGPRTWTDAAVEFFGYDPLAKDLYRKLSGQFEEHIS